MCVSDRYSSKLGSIVALTRCVGSGRVLRALVVMDRFSRDRSPCLPLPPPFRTSPGHDDSSSDSLLRLIPLAVFVFEGLQQAGSIVSVKYMLGYHS